MELFEVTYTITSAGHTPATITETVEAETSHVARGLVRDRLEQEGGHTITYMFSTPALVPETVQKPEKAPDPPPVQNDVPKSTAYSRLTPAQKRAYQAADVKRRKLVGARIPRDRAALVEEAAHLTGRSAYQFTVDALEHELERFREETAAEFAAYQFGQARGPEDGTTTSCDDPELSGNIWGLDWPQDVVV